MSVKKKYKLDESSESEESNELQLPKMRVKKKPLGKNLSSKSPNLLKDKYNGFGKKKPVLS